MVNFSTTNIVGSASTTTWSQAQTVLNSDNQQVMIVIQLRRKDPDSLVDLVSVGSQILSEIEQTGQAGIEKVIAELSEGIEMSILVATLSGTNLKIAGKGEVEVYLARGGELARLPNDAVGEIKEGDVVVLSTNKFSEVVTLAKFREIVVRERDPAELLAPLVHMQTETSGVAGVVGVVKSEKQAIKWPQIRLRSEGNPRQINLWIGGVILLLLVMMVGVGMVRRVKVEAEREYTSLNTSVSAKLTETLSIGDINPERARQLLSQARGEVEAYLATNIKENYKEKGRKLITEIDKADEKAFKKNEIKLATIVELPILFDGLRAEKMKSDGKGNLIFLDKENSKIVSMNLSDRSREVINADKSEDFVDLGVSEAKIYGLNASGVSELFWKKDTSKRMIEPDEFWKEPARIAVFAGNVYVLDREQGEIWKYPTLGETFGGRRRWFASGIAPDLTNVVDMKVVGDVWLLTSTGKLERYSRGAPVAFPMEGFPAKDEAKKLSDPSAIWVSDSLVYALENGASRIVVFGTDGKYQSQYVSEEFAKASDLVVVDDKGYVLIDNTVKEFGL